MQCLKIGHKAGLGAMAACLILGTTSLGRTQTFDSPALDFILEGPSASPQSLPSFPLTLNIGDFDPSILAGGDRALNEVAIGGISVQDPETEVVTYRYWTIVHDDAANTRSLVQSEPSDLVQTEGEEPFFLATDSLQLLDLNGDGVDDMAHLAVVDPDFAGSGPALVIGLPSQEGPNFFATSLNELGSQTNGGIPTVVNSDGSQPNMAAGDFDGDGQIDLAIYDFIDGDPGSQLAVTLQNNGGLGLLPRTETELNLPPDLLSQNFAFNLVAADVDGDGPLDLAITFDTLESEDIPDQLMVFKGNGDGTFAPDPLLVVELGAERQLVSLVAGDFDGNGFLDFATAHRDIFADPLASELLVLFCSPGSPATCELETLNLPNEQVINLAGGDFDGDGLDDLAAAALACGDEDCELALGGVEIRLNQGASFVAAPDQVLDLGGSPDRRAIFQVVSKDIDACGGPDLAYTGIQIPEEPEASDEPLPTGLFGDVVNYASVAFNHNDDPVADAGTPTPSGGGFLVGGDPTCAGELGEELTVQWEVLSGDAEISDPNAANPLVTTSGSSVLQVTCADLCGAASSATVTVTDGGGNILLNGSGCSLGHSSVGGLSWLLGLAALLPMAWRRRR